jgi:hypothetical protein
MKDEVKPYSNHFILHLAAFILTSTRGGVG